jgi:hypothetical protein
MIARSQYGSVVLGCAGYGIAVVHLGGYRIRCRQDKTNRAKHGVSLIVGRIFPAPLPKSGVLPSGRVEGRLFACAYTMHGPVYRVISVCKANRREQRKWLS